MLGYAGFDCVHSNVKVGGRGRGRGRRRGRVMCVLFGQPREVVLVGVGEGALMSMGIGHYE